MAGGNYSWLEVEGAGGDGRYRDPIVSWRPAEASPSGAAIVGGTLYVTALRGERLRSVPLDARGGAGEPEALLASEYGRLRQAASEPDGALWVVTSNRDGVATRRTTTGSSASRRAGDERTASHELA